MEKYYIDSNVFLNPILYDSDINPESQLAKEFLQRVIQKEFKAITATLTWDEIVWVISKSYNRDMANEKGKEFLIFPSLKFCPITLEILHEAQKFLSKYEIAPRDAIHAACAIHEKVTAIISFDDDFDVIKNIKRIAPF